MSISDISVMDAMEMVNNETQRSSSIDFKNWKLYLHALGPIPGLLLYTCMHLKQHPNSTLNDLHLHISGEIQGRNQIHMGDKQDVAFTFLAILEQWDLRTIDLKFSQFVYQMILSGQFNITPTYRLEIPLVFVEPLFDVFGKEWEWLKTLITNAIRGQVNPGDLDFFPCCFYSFKLYLFRILGIKNRTMEQLFKGYT
jgi:hypothetical protein